MASKLRVDEIVSAEGNAVSIGTATFSGPLSGDISGLNVTGVITATTLNQDVSGGINVTGVVTATSFAGDLTGNVTSTGVNVTGIVTVSSSIKVGDKFIDSTGIGLGTTDTTGRNAGIGTAIGTLIYNSSTLQVEVWDGYGWMGGLNTPFATSGDNPNPYTGYVSYTFTGPGSFVVSSGAGTVDLLLVGGGGAGGGARGSNTSPSQATYPGNRGGCGMVQIRYLTSEVTFSRGG